METKVATKAGTEELVRRHVDYFNKRNLPEGAKHVTAEFESANVPLDESHRGPKGYQQSAEGWITAFPDAKMEVTRVIAGENSAVLEFRGKGTHKGILKGPNGPIKPTGKKLDMPFVEVHEFKGEKLHRMSLYFDVATMMRQLGIDL